jgi:signal peptidase II
MILKKNIKLFLRFVIIVFFIDQISKLLVVQYLTPFQPPIEIIGSYLRFKLTYNPYGVFSISFGHDAIYYILSIIVIVVFTYIGLSLKDKVSVIVFGIIIGAAIGNIFDRLRVGYVIDFIDMGIGNLRWFVYNPADAFITVSIIFLLVREVFFKKTIS